MRSIRSSRSRRAARCLRGLMGSESKDDPRAIANVLRVFKASKTKRALLVTNQAQQWHHHDSSCAEKADPRCEPLNEEG
ncbi:hypothetical protein IF2G_06943 [Cordyceps javanica]|nr:hypothetical protein IF2G_06943 [Cordyceps javanica]